MCYATAMLSPNPRSYTQRRRRYTSKRSATSVGPKSQRARDPFPYVSRVTLLTRGEAAFFGPLQEAVNGKFLIMSKVRLADIVTCSKSKWRTGFGGAISQKHLDFVLCDRKTTGFVLAVELDDRSHEAEHRKRRDRFLNEVLASVGIRILRIRARPFYSVSELRQTLFNALGCHDRSSHIMPNR